MSPGRTGSVGGTVVDSGSDPEELKIDKNKRKCTKQE